MCWFLVCLGCGSGICVCFRSFAFVVCWLLLPSGSDCCPFVFIVVGLCLVYHRCECCRLCVFVVVL